MPAEDLKGHRERLRQKFLNHGLKGLHDYEAVEMLLTYVIPRRDVKPLAKRLLAKFHNISALLDASKEELCEVKGISENSAGLILLLKELCSEYLSGKMRDKDVLSTPDAVINFARMKLSGTQIEAFMVIYLNVKNHVIDYDVVQEGTVDQAVIYPRNILKDALAKNATGLILVHNHPSGICDPSEQDIRLTSAIKNAAKTFNINLLDHLIVGKAGFCSFVKEGLL